MRGRGDCSAFFADGFLPLEPTRLPNSDRPSLVASRRLSSPKVRISSSKAMKATSSSSFVAAKSNVPRMARRCEASYRPPCSPPCLHPPRLTGLLLVLQHAPSTQLLSSAFPVLFQVSDRLKRGDFFGELALLSKDKRAATVCAHQTHIARPPYPRPHFPALTFAAD